MKSYPHYYELNSVKFKCHSEASSAVMATIDSPARADPSAIRLIDYPSSESEQESETQPASQVKKRSGEGGKRHVNKHYKSAEFVDSESDISDSPTKHRSTHTSASNNIATTT